MLKANYFKNDSVVLNQMLRPGIFIGSSISTESRPFVRILNMTEKTAFLDAAEIGTEQLSNYDVLGGPTTSNDSFRTPDHKRKILDILKKTFPREHAEELLTVCEDYTHVFAHSDSALTVNNFYKQELRLIDKEPVFTKQYPIPFSQREELKAQVNKMLESGILRHSRSEYSSPCLLVPKKGGKWRLVIDFRNINKKLVGDKFPLPRLEDCLQFLNKAKYLSVVDLAQGFLQVPLEEDSKKYTAFMTEFGFFEFNRLPFGMKIAPNSFMRMMLIAFAGLIPEIAVDYLDDVLIVGRTKKEHLMNLRRIFERCEKTNLKLNAEKCQFFLPEVYYFGHKLTREGIRPDDRKYEAIIKWPTPVKPDDCRRFAFLANYFRNFIPRFAEIVDPLYTSAALKPSNFKWTEIHQRSFDELKRIITSDQCLAYPNFDFPFIITSDASDKGVGCTLSQEYDGKPHVISYASRSFKRSDLHKAIVHKELIGVHFAIEHYKPYAFGRAFTVRTDCKALVYLFKLKNPTSRLNRIRIELAEYDFQIEHVKGSENVLCDALSRIHVKDLAEDYESVMKVTTRLQAQKAEQTKIIAEPSTNYERQSPKIMQPKLMEAIGLHEVLKFPEIKTNMCTLKVEVGRNVHCKNKKIIYGSMNKVNKLANLLEE